MRVQFSVVGNVDHYDGPEWGEMEAIPRVGEWLHLPGLPELISCVREVIWYPFGDPEVEDDGQSFVYLVIGPHRSTPRTPDRAGRVPLTGSPEGGAT